MEKINCYRAISQTVLILSIAINRAEHVYATVIIKHNYMLIYNHTVVINIMLCLLNSAGHIFRSYCSSLYCCSLWSDYRKATYRKLTVAFNNIRRPMLGLPWRCSANAMYANYDLPNIDNVIRKSLFGFIQRLSVSHNSIVRSNEQSWFV